MATLTERLLLIIDAEGKGASSEFSGLTTQVDRTGKALDDVSKKGTTLGTSLKSGLALGAGALLGGGLANAIVGIGKDFIESAKGAEIFANTTNSTVEEASKFMGMAKQMNLTINDLIEIVAEFTPAAKAMGSELGELGIEFQKNADGTTNMTLTLVDALAALQKIPDDVTRVETAVKLFGEEGSKQLAKIYNGSRDVRDVFEEMTGLDIGDVEAARQWEEAMRELSVAGRSLGLAMAGVVIPALSTFASLITPLAGALSKIPPELLLISGGLLAFQRFGPGLSTLTAGFSGLGDNLAYQRTLAAGMGKELTTLQATMAATGGAARTLGGNIMSALGGPVGLALIGATVGITAIQSAIDAANKEVATFLPRLDELKESGKSTGAAMKQTAQEIDAQASVFQRFGAEVKGSSGWENAFIGPVGQLAQAMTKGGDSVKGFEEELRKQAEAMGPAAEAAAALTLQTKALADVIAEGTTSGQAFTDAVRETATAQVENKANTDLATAAVDAYIASTTGAVDATLAASSSIYAERDAFRSAQEAIASAATTVDDAATVTDEAAAAQDSAGEAALRFAAATLTAAEDQAALRGEVLSAAQAADIQIAALQSLAAQPGISEATKANIQALIDQLTTAKTKGDEGVEVKVGQHGAEETGAQIDSAADKDRTAEVDVESRNGPAVISYLDGIASQTRLALIQVESRNGPAVISYLDSIAAKDRMALIRVESRNGPAVDDYLDSLASQSRTAIINIETRGAAAASAAVRGAAATPAAAMAPTAAPAMVTGLGAVNRLAPAPMAGAGGSSTTTRYGLGAGGGGGVIVQNSYRISVDIAPNHNPAEVGRAIVDDIRAFESTAGRGWRR